MLQRDEQNAGPPQEEDYVPDWLEEARTQQVAETQLGLTFFERMPVWGRSVFTASLGLGATVFLFVHPSLCRLPLPLGGTLFVPYLVLFLPVLSIVWAAVGILGRDYRQQWRRCSIGMVMGLLSLGGVIAAFWFDPSRW